MEFLSEFFNDRLISKDLWPPKSPDHFHLWGMLKDSVYLSNPQTIAQLKAAITAEMEKVKAFTLERVFRNMVRRARLCIWCRGGHIQNEL